MFLSLASRSYLSLSMHQVRVVWSSNANPPTQPPDTVLRTIDPVEFKSVRQSVVSCVILLSSSARRPSSRVDVQYLHDYGLEINTGRIKGSLWPSNGKIDQKSSSDFFF